MSPPSQEHVTTAPEAHRRYPRSPSPPPPKHASTISEPVATPPPSASRHRPRSPSPPPPEHTYTIAGARRHPRCPSPPSEPSPSSETVAATRGRRRHWYISKNILFFDKLPILRCFIFTLLLPN
ncbi:hypothetical protein GUJ93_ZPchr0006g42558 [Zizania palustris]|uniref:Uncharacterized protein n=1 Tax=Zizania palustris TaxID=103762 RepID=A0A8J5TDK9_ZIZPA|nr:hypothetical protein GUJ93_ZPchr0006g42558 [Zizania palustris]